MNGISVFDHHLLEMMKSIAREGIDHAAEGFSGMIGRRIQVIDPAAKLVPVMSIPAIVGRYEDDAVGIYLRFKGDMVGQIMMIVPVEKARELVDLLLGVKPGTTTELGALERSALGELGNLCGSFFLNAMARIFKLGFHPSPPAVMVDMVGAILDVIVATADGISDQALLIQANFVDGPRSVDADFWVIPDMSSLKSLVEKISDL